MACELGKGGHKLNAVLSAKREVELPKTSKGSESQSSHPKAATAKRTLLSPGPAFGKTLDQLNLCARLPAGEFLRGDSGLTRITPRPTATNPSVRAHRGEQLPKPVLCRRQFGLAGDPLPALSTNHRHWEIFQTSSVCGCSCQNQWDPIWGFPVHHPILSIRDPYIIHLNIAL